MGSSRTSAWEDTESVRSTAVSSVMLSASFGQTSSVANGEAGPETTVVPSSSMYSAKKGRISSEWRSMETKSVSGKQREDGSALRKAGLSGRGGEAGASNQK